MAGLRIAPQAVSTVVFVKHGIPPPRAVKVVQNAGRIVPASKTFVVDGHLRDFCRVVSQQAVLHGVGFDGLQALCVQSQERSRGSAQGMLTISAVQPIRRRIDEHGEPAG